jgi:hypothetical protein
MASPTVNAPETLESPHKGQRGVRRLFNAFFYSLSGLRIAFNPKAHSGRKSRSRWSLFPLRVSYRSAPRSAFC